MNSSASPEMHPNHPLAGLESWPRTGPVYGFAEDERPRGARTFWARIGERLRKAPDDAPEQSANIRIWY
ncbi:MAG: hypothetical protein JWL86_6719 [Rhizobium sp.]|nr:hypothetical protein [Rhizobium sp.]